MERPNIKLSILVCTVVGREQSLSRLLAVLKPQLKNSTQLLILKDNKEISVGAKRQRLLEAATGDYICYIDDDDLISSDYVEQLLTAIESNPDCVGFEIKCNVNGVSSRGISSLKYKRWTEGKDGYKYNRSIYHKTPVKRELALKVGFKDMRYAEDHDYSIGIMRLLKTEVFIPKELYYYTRIDNEEHNKRYGIGR